MDPVMKHPRIQAMDEEKKKEAELAWQPLRLHMSKAREELGPVAYRRWVFQNVLEVEEKMATEQDESLIFEEIDFESADRAKEIKTKLGLLYAEFGNSAAEWFINELRVGGEMELNDFEMCFTKLGLLSEECVYLFENCGISAANLCIKRMSIGALVDKVDKWKILEGEISEARRMKKEIEDRILEFCKNIRRVSKKEVITITKQDDSEAVLAIGDEKPEEKVSGKDPTSAFIKQSLRVVMEVMKGVNIGEKLDEAMALVDEWAFANVEKCIYKVAFGIFVERISIFQVMENELAETRRMQKEVDDRLVNS